MFCRKVRFLKLKFHTEVKCTLKNVKCTLKKYTLRVQIINMISAGFFQHDYASYFSKKLKNYSLTWPHYIVSVVNWENDNPYLKVLIFTRIWINWVCCGLLMRTDKDLLHKIDKSEMYTFSNYSKVNRGHLVR